MSVRQRLLLSLIALILLLGGPAVYGVLRLQAVRDVAVELQERHATALGALGELRSSLAELDRAHRALVAVPGPEVRRAVFAALERSREEVATIRSVGYGTTVDPVATSLDSVRSATMHLDSLLRTDDLTAATGFFRQGVEPRLQQTQLDLMSLEEDVNRRSVAAARQARRLAASATGTTAVAFIVALVLALAVGTWTTRSLTSPLHDLRSAMRRVEDGDLAPPDNLDDERPDEIGDLARSFRSMTRQLAQLNDMRAEFISVASHRLKSPVSVIRGYTEMVLENAYGEVSEGQRRALEAVRDQAEALTGLVNKLLTVGRLESGQPGIERSTVDVRGMLADLEQIFRAQARQKEIEFVVAPADSLPSRIPGDTGRLRDEVFGNLLENAFKYTPRGGRVSLRARGEDDRVVVEVKDTGPGIAEHELPHVFERYYRGEDTGEETGTGVGLYVAREVVEAHGGSITLRSSPDEGTVARVALPDGEPPPKT